MGITGDEKFTFNGVSQEMSLIDFWRFRYSNIYDIQGAIAEFIVARALGITSAHNIEYWTLWDITYQDLRIEVKESSYYHPWNKDRQVSESRKFGITKANSRFAENATGHVDESFQNTLERQNDLYVFCLNTGDTLEESYPLNLNHWEFYVVPTFVINETCKDNKTISLPRVKKLASAVRYDQLKGEVDKIVHIIRQTRTTSKKVQ